MKNLHFNDKYTSKDMPRDRFDQAIENAIARSEEMQIEYAKASFASSVSRFVREQRKKNRLTQAELARAVAIPQSFIARLENPISEKEPSLSTLAKVAYAFGFKVKIDFELDRMARRLTTIAGQ